MTPERHFQVDNLHEACVQSGPATVLEVGYPLDVFIPPSLWECAKVTYIDPFVDKADLRIRFEDYCGPKFDLVNMTSVIDYFDDPVAGLRKADEVGRYVLVQGRLNTYRDVNFKTRWWAPTKECIEQQFPKYLPSHDVVWLKFFGYQMFSIFLRSRDDKKR